LCGWRRVGGRPQINELRINGQGIPKFIHFFSFKDTSAIGGLSAFKSGFSLQLLQPPIVWFSVLAALTFPIHLRNVCILGYFILLVTL
jgi:hypothetical protein